MTGASPGAELAGRWALTRTVTDRRTGRSGTVAGTLVIAVEPARIGWYESGLLTWAGRTTPVGRTTYLVEVDGDPWVTFADGRLFHPWRPGQQVEHPCGDDLYVGRLEVDGARMRTTWQVTGPAKDQLLQTWLRQR